MSYVDGIIVPVRNAKKDAYKELASKAAAIWREHGATRVVDCWGDDVPDGKVTDFKRSVKAEADETVVFSWIEWPDKATRDEGMKKMMSDSRMQFGPDTPFDGKRMIFGGFNPLRDEG